MFMKKLLVIISLVCFGLTIMAQPGKYAGTKKGLIKTVYTDSRNIPGLKGWSFIEGSVLSSLHDLEMITVDVFKKGTTVVVFFSIKEDSALQEFTIADALEIKPVTKGWIIKTSFCRQNATENPWIVAWAKISPTEYLKIFKKAWRFNQDKRQIEIVSSKGIDCLNEEFDMH